MILVKDFCKIVVKTNPSKIINIIIPVRIVKPNKKKVFLLSFPENLFDKKARNPGYMGRTHTAVRGVNNPRMKEVAKLVSKDIQHPLLISSFNLSGLLTVNPPSFLKLKSSQINIIGVEGALIIEFPNSSIKTCVISTGATA